MNVHLVISGVFIGTPDPNTPGPLGANANYDTIDPTTGETVVGSGQSVGGNSIVLPSDQRDWKQAILDAVLADALLHDWTGVKVIWLQEIDARVEKL